MPKTCLRALLLALTALAGAGPGLAAISVSYDSPQEFRDFEFRNSRTRASALSEFDRFFQKIADRHLPDCQDLRIEVLDIDLAGDVEPWNFDLREVRVMRDVTPPQMRLRYVLSDGKQIVKRDEARLIDMNYLWDPRARRSNERFAYDKRMLEDWFTKTFAAKAGDVCAPKHSGG